MPFTLKEQKLDLLIPKGIQTLQLNFDEHVNVADIKPDIDRVLQTNAVVSITKEEISGEQILISGELKTNILYLPLNDKKPIHSMDVVVPFDESINVSNLQSKDVFKVDHTIEDISVELINSRKVNMRALVQLKCEVSEKREAYLTADVDTADNIEKQVKKINLCQLKENSKVNYKIKDEVALPAGKPNIMELLWNDVTIQNKEVKLIDGKVNIKGTLHLATLYMAQDADNHLEFVEHDIGFNGLLDCPGCKEDMIHDVQMKIMNHNVQVRLDLDGEERALSVEAETKVDAKVYDEQEASVLSDVYALDKDLTLKTEPVTFQKLLCKNQSQSNIKEAVAIENEDNEILQIYYTSGQCVLDHMSLENDKVVVEGTLLCKVMYVAADDRMPIRVFETFVPFVHNVDIKGLKPDNRVSVSPTVNYIGCTMIGEKEIELRSSIGMNTLVFEDCTLDTISEIEEKPLDIKSLQKIPGIVGYIVKEKDTLWDIAKKYRTKIRSIKETNGLESDRISKGDQLIIVKEVQF